jgi:hypothetical protein
MEIPMPDVATATFTCASCEARIAGAPVIHVGVAFCCAGCVAGGPCLCSYDVAHGGIRPERSNVCEETDGDERRRLAARPAANANEFFGADGNRHARVVPARARSAVADDERGQVAPHR